MTAEKRLEIFFAARTVSIAERIVCFRRLCSRHSDSDPNARNVVFAGGRVEDIGDGLVDQ